MRQNSSGSFCNLFFIFCCFCFWRSNIQKLASCGFWKAGLQKFAASRNAPVKCCGILVPWKLCRKQQIKWFLPAEQECCEHTDRSDRSRSVWGYFHWNTFCCSRFKLLKSPRSPSLCGGDAHKLLTAASQADRKCLIHSKNICESKRSLRTSGQMLPVSVHIVSSVNSLPLPALTSYRK